MNTLHKIGVSLSIFSKRSLCPNCRKYIQRCNYRVSPASNGIFEPDGLNPPPEIPEYETLQIRMRGYDFPVLDTFAQYANSIIGGLGLTRFGFAVPGKSMHIDLFYPNSARVEHTYDLTKYERVVQMEKVPSTIVPIIIQVLRLNAPAGVEVTIKKPDPKEDEDRYLPDKELIKLKESVEQIHAKKEEIKKGRY